MTEAAPRVPPHYESPEPANDAQRVAAVEALGLFNTPPEERIDIFTRLVANIFRVTAAGVGLIGGEDIYYKSLLCEGWPPACLYNRKAAICSHVVKYEEPKPFIMRDLKNSDVFFDHPNVISGPKWGFYAGVPLIGKNGLGLGSLCAMTQEARPDFSEIDIKIMEDLAKMVVQELETTRENIHVKAINREQKAQNRTLQATNDLLLRALSHSSEGIMMFDEELKMMYVNDGWSRITGHSKEDSEGRTLLDVLATPSRNVIEDMFDRLSKNISSEADDAIGEIECVHRNGKTFWARFQMSGFKENLDSKSVHIICVLSDITALKNEQFKLIKAKEEAERATRAAEVASQAKTNFLTNMSHELRTPLHGILGCIQVLSRSPLAPEQRKWVVTVQKSCAVLCDIVNDLLDMSKIAVRKMKIESHPFDIAALAEEVAEITAANALEKGLDVAVCVPAACLVPILGDKARVRRILMNFISNAIKFTASGCVVLRASVERETPSHVTLRFAVTDTGIGIRKEDQALLFQRFSQIDEGPTRQFGGTGLGLALARELATMMHGDAGVESEFGKGATFWFTAVFERQVKSPMPTRLPEPEELSTAPAPSVNPANSNNHNNHNAPHSPPRDSTTASQASTLAAPTAVGASRGNSTASPRSSQPSETSSNKGEKADKADKAPRETLLQVAGLGDHTLAGFTADEVKGSLNDFTFVLAHPHPLVGAAIRDLLTDSGARCEVAETTGAALVALGKVKEHGVVVALVDEHVPNAQGLCEKLAKEDAYISVAVIYLGSSSADVEVAATLRKPFTRTALIQALAEVDLDMESDGLESRPRTPGEDTVAPIRVLVVDDNETNLAVAVESLKTLGYHHVTTAGSGERAVEVFQETLASAPFDVILLDIHMPGTMDGFAACRAIRDAERTSGSADMVPILAMTAGVTNDELTQCQAAGFSRILDKPWSMDTLESLMSRCVLARRGLMDVTGKFKGSKVSSVANISSSVGGNFTPSGPLLARPLSPPVQQPYTPAPPPSAVIVVAIRNMISSMMLCQILTVEALTPRMASDLAAVEVPAHEYSIVFAEADAPDFDAGLSRLASKPCVVIALTGTGAVKSAAAGLLVDVVPLRVPYTPDVLQGALKEAQQHLMARSLPAHYLAMSMEASSDDLTASQSAARSSRGSSGLRAASVEGANAAKRITRRRGNGGANNGGKSDGKNNGFQRATGSLVAAGAILEESTTDMDAVAAWGPTYNKQAISAVRLLVVDDTPLNVIMMTQYLRDVGFANIDTAENGLIASTKYAEALDSKHPYDLVLLDILMPVMDGYQAATKMRETEKAKGIKETPVIAVTANNSAADRERCLSYGITDYLGKPYEAKQLYQVMCKYLTHA